MVRISGIEFTNEQVEKLFELGALDIARKNDPGSTSLANTPALHGPRQGGNGYGTFSRMGSRPEMYSTFARPESVLSLMSLKPSELSEELIEIMSGVTDSSGTNASGFCDPNAPTPGAIKGSRQKFLWGDYLSKTNLNAVPLVGQLRNRADVPRQIINSGAAANPLIPETMFQFPTDTRDQLQTELWLTGVALERSLEVVTVRGDRSLTGANRRWGWITEFGGLTGQIKTGYTDVDTGILIPAMDSAVISYNSAITGTAGDGSGRNITQCLADLWFGLNQRASKVQMSGTNWAFVGRSELHRALSYVIACQYYVNSCGFTGSSDGNRQDMSATRALFDAMLNGKYILIDGVQVPFIASEGILQETVANATYKSDLLLVPVDFAGRPLLNLEYFDMNNPYATRYAGFSNMNSQTVLNNGLFMVGKQETALCKEFHFAARMRLILEAPFLAGRIDALQYTFRAPIKNALPGDSFYANGGITIVPA